MGARIFDDEGLSTVAIPYPPALFRLVDPAAVAARHMPEILRNCRQIGARPIAGATPEILSEREMRQVDPQAVLWRPGCVWLAIPVVRDDGESVTEYRDLEPDG